MSANSVRAVWIAMTVLAGACEPAQNQRRPVTFSAASFVTNSRLVLVPVTVIDRHGAFVNGLTREAFTITEDGVQQRIWSFSEDDAPVSIGIIFDLSGSMKSSLDVAKASLRALLKDANAADEAFLETVSTQPGTRAGFTNELDKIVSGVALARADGETALIDTIFNGLTQMRAARHPRKAVVIVSDGMDNHSRHSREELFRRAVESDAQIYTISINGAVPNRKPVELHEETRGLFLMEELAAKTGGFSVAVANAGETENAAGRIGRALRNQYSIGYSPLTAAPAGKWRRIRVTVTGPGLKAYGRLGYRIE
jgi:Ca-activated chloride channel family protein